MMSRSTAYKSLQQTLRMQVRIAIGLLVMLGYHWQAKAAYPYRHTPGRLRRELGVSRDLPGRMHLAHGGFYTWQGIIRAHESYSSGFYSSL